MDGWIGRTFVLILAMAPATVSLSPKFGLVMIVVNLIPMPIAIGNATIKQVNDGMQPPSSSLFGSLNHVTLLEMISFSHNLVMRTIQ
jgi:photosystem I subunit 10